ncbi:hypothetical protein EON79_03605 [bacterium]|nr:MAG: hypothetical protein EON79_03605 [bacterium]
MPLLPIALTLAMAKPEEIRPRFEMRTPLEGVPGVMMDTRNVDVGVAQQFARAKGVQARILWIDATANLDRYNTETKIVDLVARIADSGFNTIVFDIKPISGQVIYKSAFAPKLMEWRNKSMAGDFDPVPFMVREAKSRGLGIYASLNAFSEGHRMFMVGPGYSLPDQQTVLYESQPVLRAPEGDTMPIGPTGVQYYASAAQVPMTGGFALTYRPNGQIVDGFDDPTTAPTVPAKGGVLFGTPGPAADFLRRFGNPGQKVKIEAQTLYVPIRERPEQQYPLMMNPNHPAVRDYEFSIVEEVVRNYAFDGIVYDDRLRYAGLNADFSELTRAKFEESVGRKLTWPNDVFSYVYNPNMVRGIRPGPFYDAWLAWRAGVLKGFVAEVKERIQAIRPNTQLGVYAGSWYGEYASIGNNWASPEVEGGFWYLTPEYRQTGFAPLVDFLITGCYYPTATIYDAMGQSKPIGPTVEAAGLLTNRLAGDATWTYAGIMLSDFKENPEGLADAMQAACGATQGVMVFDLSHDIEPMWPVFKQAFTVPRKAPHSDPALMTEVRKRRAALERAGVKQPPVPFLTGAPGAGQ